MLANKFIRYLLLASLAIFGGSLLAYFYQNPPFQQPSEAACLGSPQKIQFTLHPDFYLNKKFLPAQSLSEKDLAAYIERHLRFTVTTVQNFNKLSSPKFATIPADGYKISKVSAEATTYPLALTIWKGGFFQTFFDKIAAPKDIDADYMARALVAGKTTLQDEALHVSYEAEITMYVCDAGKDKFSDNLNLPLDPFLAFWFVPEDKQVTQFHEVFKADFAGTPCANSDFINDYDPYYYWYYWSLDEKGCEAAVTKNSFKEFPVLNKQNLTLVPEKTFDLKFLESTRGRPLKVSAIFTMIDDDSVIVPDPFAPALADVINEAVATENFSQLRNDLESLANFDIALRTGLIFAWSMRKISTDFKLEQLTLEDMFLQWRLTGKLKESQQPYEIMVTVGSAIESKPTYKRFYEALNQGFAESDIVYFGGHSGVGKNLSENRLSEGIKNIYATIAPEKIPSHQLVLLMTCYSAHYFPTTNFPVPQQEGFARDFIYTASVPSGYDARVLSGLMNQVDRYFDKGQHISFARWPKAFRADAFFVHKRQ